MKIRSLIATSFLVASTANAGLITTFEAENVLENQQGVATVDFNGLAGSVGTGSTNLGNGAIISGDYSIYSDSVSGKSAEPFGFGANNDFLSVPNPTKKGIATVTLDQSYNYFGLFWGSIDKYNDLIFFDNGQVVAEFNGEDAEGLIPNGGQTSWNSNRFINFFFTDGMSFDSYALSSNGYAFESDNHAFGSVSVSEPATLALFGLGLAALGLVRRRT